MATDGLPRIEDLSLLSLQGQIVDVPLCTDYPESDNTYSDYPFNAFKPKGKNSISKKKENEHGTNDNRGHEADVREIPGKTLLLGNGPSPDICSVGKNTSTHVWYRTISTRTVRGTPPGSGTNKSGVSNVGAKVGNAKGGTPLLDAAPEIPTYEYDTRKRKWLPDVYDNADIRHHVTGNSLFENLADLTQDNQ